MSLSLSQLGLPTLRITEVLKLEPYQLDGTLLLGMPGIGKTAVIREYAERHAKALGRRFIDVRETSINELRKVYENPEEYYVYMRLIAPHVFPEDVSIPRLYSEYVVHLAPLPISVFGRRGIQGLLFVDELTIVERKDQLALYYSFLQERELGWSVRLSDDVVVVAAGNPPAYNSDARELPAPVVNRLSLVEVLPPTVEEWVEYMESHYARWDRRVAEYLRLNPEDLIRPPREGRLLRPFPSPRSWTKAALKTYSADPELAAKIIAATVGREQAAKFLALNRLPVSVSELLERPWLYWDKLGAGHKWFVVQVLSQNPELAYRYARNLYRVFESDHEYLVLLLKSIRDAKAKARLVAAFADLLLRFADSIAEWLPEPEMPEEAKW